MGDQKIEDQLNTLRDMIKTVDPKELKEKDQIGNQLEVMAAQTAKDAAAISDVSEITGTYKRRIEMESALTIEHHGHGENL